MWVTLRDGSHTVYCHQRNLAGNQQLSRRAPPRVRVVVTFKSLVWILSSLVLTLAILSSLYSPHWLLSAHDHDDPADRQEEGEETNKLGISMQRSSIFHSHVSDGTIGIFYRCFVGNGLPSWRSEGCFIYIHPFNLPSRDFSSYLKGCVVMMLLATIFLSLQAILVVAALCIKNACRISVFFAVAYIQSFSGMLLLLGLILFPAGWGSAKITAVCGSKNSPYEPGGCKLGWAPFVCFLATIGLFITSVMALKVEASFSNYRVTQKLATDARVVCAL